MRVYLMLISSAIILLTLIACSYQFQGKMKCTGDCELIIDRQGKTIEGQ